MAVIRNDVNEVTHILSRFPGSLAELNIHGQSPVHLAAAKPQILTLLVDAADLNLLNRKDKSGTTALETAMILSGKQCVNGSGPNRCRQCACTQCMKILLAAGCNIQMQRSSGANLRTILSSASELARRRYVFHMKELKTPRPRRLQRPLIKRIIGGTGTTWDAGRAKSGFCQSPKSDVHVKNDEAEDWSWIYDELDDSHHAGLFYRHGFQLHPSFFIDPSLKYFYEEYPSLTYTCWLVEHGADLFLRSSTGPPVIKDSPSTGLFGAHYIFYHLGGRLIPESSTFNKLSVGVVRRKLTDGCQCNCSICGCSPFIWMMKRLSWSSNPEFWARRMFDYYSKCDVELTALTYATAIRYMTFAALDLTHTCCYAAPLAKRNSEWVERDDVDIINEEQASLLEVHDQLVTEFEKEAPKFIKIRSDGRQLFPKFWTTCWIARIKEVLEKLDGDELSDAERQGAEEIGVRWCEPPPAPVKWKHRNPYNRMSLEHWFYELDKTCPEYNEPWPEDLHRITELP